MQKLFCCFLSFITFIITFCFLLFTHWFYILLLLPCIYLTKKPGLWSTLCTYDVHCTYLTLHILIKNFCRAVFLSWFMINHLTISYLNMVKKDINWNFTWKKYDHIRYSISFSSRSLVKKYVFYHKVYCVHISTSGAEANEGCYTHKLTRNTKKKNKMLRR